MQYDSMMHLIVPSLLESGLFTEASAHYARLNSFARSARLDTSDMIAKTFKFSNYTTGLEMSRFLVRVNNSLHLRVAVSELPLLEMVTAPALSNPETACQYLDQICGSVSGAAAVLTGSVSLALPSHGLLSDTELARLDDNSDYALLVLADLTAAEEEEQRLQQRRDLEMRIRVAQRLQKVLFHALDGDVGEGEGHLASLRTLVQGGADGPNASQYSRFQQRVSCEHIGSASCSPSFSPTTDAGPGCGDGEGRGEEPGFEAALWMAILQGLGFALACAAVIEASLGKSSHDPKEASPASPSPAVKAEAEAEAGVLEVVTSKAKDAVEKSGQVLSSLSVLRAALACREQRNLPLPPPSASASASSEGKAGGKSMAAPVSPMWLRRIAALVRLLAPTVPVLLHAALVSLPCSKRPKAQKSGGFGNGSRKAKGAPKQGEGGQAEPQGDEAAMQALTKQIQAVGDANRTVTEALCKLLGTSLPSCLISPRAKGFLPFLTLPFPFIHSPIQSMFIVT